MSEFLGPEFFDPTNAARQLRRCDNELMDFRQRFNSMSLEERVNYRIWLEKVAALNDECEWEDMYLRVRLELDEFDEAGEKTREGVAEFTVWTLLEAWKAWEKGEEYTPDSVQP